MKTEEQKNQSKLWNNLYNAELYAIGSIKVDRINDPDIMAIKDRFLELNKFIQQTIKRRESTV